MCHVKEDCRLILQTVSNQQRGFRVNTIYQSGAVDQAGAYYSSSEPEPEQLKQIRRRPQLEMKDLEVN